MVKEIKINNNHSYHQSQTLTSESQKLMFVQQNIKKLEKQMNKQ